MEWLSLGVIAGIGDCRYEGLGGSGRHEPIGKCRIGMSDQRAIVLPHRYPREIRAFGRRRRL